MELVGIGNRPAGPGFSCQHGRFLWTGKRTTSWTLRRRAAKPPKAISTEIVMDCTVGYPRRATTTRPAPMPSIPIRAARSMDKDHRAFTGALENPVGKYP